jgi:hypothetical protein
MGCIFHKTPNFVAEALRIDRRAIANEDPHRQAHQGGPARPDAVASPGIRAIAGVRRR